MAKRLRVSRTTLNQMEVAGCPFPLGKCNPDWVLEWLRNNPNFRTVRPKKKKLQVVTTAPGQGGNAPSPVWWTGSTPLESDRYEGSPAFFNYNSDRSSADVYDNDGKLIGTWPNK